MITRSRCFVRTFAFIPTIVLSFLASSASAQDGYFRYPPYGSLRGRMVRRDGLFHVERYRWGNGITPAGATVLTTAIEAFAPVVTVLATGGLGRDESEKSRDAETSSDSLLPESYKEEQRAANDLLTRTTRLVDPKFAEPAPQP